MKKMVIAGGLLLASSAAAAQVSAPAPLAPRDGIQTRAEVVERTRAMFARIDANRDGFVTAEEGQALRGRALGQRPGGPMARQAGRDAGAARFERLDTNRDNMISRDEWARAQATRGERRAERGQRGGQRMAMRGRMGGAMLRLADANRDGRISLAEAEGAALQRFDRVDLNRDGQVTRDERQQLRQQRQARPAVQPVR